MAEKSGRRLRLCPCLPWLRAPALPLLELLDLVVLLLEVRRLLWFEEPELRLLLLLV